MTVLAALAAAVGVVVLVVGVACLASDRTPWD